MEKLIFVPIELLEERYSEQWFKWFTEEFKKQKVDFLTVGDTGLKTIKQGQFLDVYETHQYKLKQMLQIIDLIEKGFEGTIFFLDLWFPSIEVIGYIRDTLKKNIKIKGWFHAGTWDKFDFLTQSGLGKWSKGFEASILKLVDEIYLATNFHKNIMADYFFLNYEFTSKVKIIPYPIYFNQTLYDNNDRQDLVLFPHRLAPEKQPEQFDEIFLRYQEKFKNEYEEKNKKLPMFIRTKDVCDDKQSYYNLLSKAKVSVSTALQETFGIAMQESINCGCVPVVPDRLSYQELIKTENRYKTLDEAVDLIHEAIMNYKKPTPIYKQSVERIVEWVLK
jgi:glycosyltransferase involved in cell wall biosynthesis